MAANSEMGGAAGGSISSSAIKKRGRNEISDPEW